VPDGQAETIFEPFYQVDGSATRAHGGVGVGLAVARRVARGLGGDIRVTNGAAVAGEFFPGAAFWLTVATRAPTVVLDTSPR
jgi:signal transduction histidine kinase